MDNLLELVSDPTSLLQAIPSNKIDVFVTFKPIINSATLSPGVRSPIS
jgi:hypothetical protein